MARSNTTKLLDLHWSVNSMKSVVIASNRVVVASLSGSAGNLSVITILTIRASQSWTSRTKKLCLKELILCNPLEVSPKQLKVKTKLLQLTRPRLKRKKTQTNN
jgi:hypothetical protein